MANQTLTLSTQTTKNLTALLEETIAYEASFRALRQKILALLPEGVLRRGSPLWWEKQEYLAEKDLEFEQVSKSYNSVDELISDLHQGKLAK